MIGGCIVLDRLVLRRLFFPTHYELLEMYTLVMMSLGLCPMEGTRGSEKPTDVSFLII